MHDTPELRAVWVAIATIVAALAGASAAFLSWIGGSNPPNSILTGAAAFATVFMLLLAVLGFASNSTHRR
jgi:hypothetical protein